MPSSRILLLVPLVFCVLMFAACDRGYTLHTFQFKRAMNAGEAVRESDLNPVSIPFSSDATISVQAPDGEEHSAQDINAQAMDIWVTKDELKQYVGKKLIEDVKSGDQLLEKHFE